MQRLLALLCSAAASAAATHAAAPGLTAAPKTGSAEPFTLRVNVSNITHAIQPRTLGCHSDSGYVHNARALMAELLHGPCFDSGIGPAWTVDAVGDGTVAPDNTLLFFNKSSLKLTLPTNESEARLRRVAVANRGLGGGGLALQAGQPYVASVWVHPAEGSAGGPKLWVSAALEDRITSTTLAAATQLLPTTDGWVKLTFALTPSRGTACESITPGADPTIKCTDPRPQQPGEAPYPLYSVGHLCLRCGGQIVFSLSDNPSLPAARRRAPAIQPSRKAVAAAVHLGYPSLLPGPWGMWEGMAVSSRNVPFLTKMGTKLIRLGGSFASADSWLWSNWRGPAHTRPASACSGASSDFAGWGMFDFLDFASAAGIDGVVTTTLGTPTQMADLVEYALGNTSTALGSLRAADGHPSPYLLTYISFFILPFILQSIW